MDSQDFAEMRKRVGLTQSQVAAALGVTSRTISTWESALPPKQLSLMEARAVSELFRSQLLGRTLPDMCERAFSAIPSEIVNIWVMDGPDCILLPEATRQQDPSKNTRRDVLSALAVSPLVVQSMTTEPLRSGSPINLAGDHIKKHPSKRYPGNRAGQYFFAGICESLLHVPAFTPSAHGPLPVLLLSLQNRLDEQGKVIIPKEGRVQLYSAEDQTIAEGLAEEFRDLLLPDMQLLDMID